MMEIIDKAHAEIKRRRRVGKPFISFSRNNRNISFSAEAALRFGLAPGLYAHFVNDENYWWFFCDTDPKTGFAITDRPGETVAITSTHLVNMFCSRTKCGTPSKFLLTETEAKHNGHHLIKIEINKPL